MNVLRNGEIWLHGTVGNGFFTPGFTAADVADALSQIGRRKPIIVHLNSGGGIASEGAAIYAVLNDHPGDKTVIVEGVAASAASVVAMSGDEIIMRRGAVMMIHDPAGITMGTSEDHQKTVEALEALADSMAEIYAERSGKTPEEAREDMKEELWLTAGEAVKQGYATHADSGKSKAIAAFDYRLYSNAPDRFVALAERNGWETSDADAAGAANDEDEEMTEIAKKGGTTSPSAVETPEFKAAVDTAVADALKKRDDDAAKKEADDKAKAAAAAGNETPEQITARVREEERKRMADITAACTLAGQAAKAATFIADGKSLSEVVAALQAERAGGGGSTTKQTAAAGDKELNPHRTVGVQTATAGNGTALDDPSAAWKRTTDKINARNGRVGT